MLQSGREREANLYAILEREASARFEFAAECSRRVAFGVNLPTGELIIGQLHDVIEIAFVIVASNVQDRDLAWVGAGDGLELLEALELAFVGAVGVEGGAIDNFDRAVAAHHVATEPHLAVAAAANAAEQFVVGDGGR